MKTLKYIPVLFCLLLTACFEDETTLDTVRISEITIDTLQLQKIYNIDKNEELIIPTADIVSESEKQLPLRYEWEVNYKLYSDSSVFRYAGWDLGSFPVRLKVSNEHGSSFYEFTLNVNSPYEKGIAILSEDGQGTPMFSFMRELSDSEQAAGENRKFTTHGLTINNPDHIFPKYPTDLVQRDKQLFLSFEGTPSIYMLNSKVLNIENIITDNDPNFIPKKLLIPDNTATSAAVLTTSNKVYKLATLEGVVLTYPELTSEYTTAIVYGSDYAVATILWDMHAPAINNYFNAYYLYSTTDTEVGMDFTGHEPVALFDRDGQYFTMLTHKNNAFMKTSIAYNWKAYDADYNYLGIDILDRQVAIAGSPELTPESPYISCKTYQCLFYAVGNRIYRWYYNATAFPTTPWKTLDDLEGAEITSLGISPDDKQLYVGVYQPGQPDLNGSIYILNSDTGKYEEKSPYRNVAYKPIKIIYKKQ